VCCVLCASLVYEWCLPMDPSCRGLGHPRQKLRLCIAPSPPLPPNTHPPMPLLSPLAVMTMPPLAPLAMVPLDSSPVDWKCTRTLVGSSVGAALAGSNTLLLRVALLLVVPLAEGSPRRLSLLRMASGEVGGTSVIFLTGTMGCSCWCCRDDEDDDRRRASRAEAGLATMYRYAMMKTSRRKETHCGCGAIVTSVKGSSNPLSSLSSAMDTSTHDSVEQHLNQFCQGLFWLRIGSSRAQAEVRYTQRTLAHPSPKI
jgi:hypothetical protein